MLIMKTMCVSGLASLMDFAPAEGILPIDMKDPLRSACILVLPRHLLSGAIFYV